MPSRPPGWHDCISDNPKVENLGSKKFFWKTSFDVLMEWSRIITHGVRQLFLVTNHVRFWKKHNALLLCQNEFFSKTVSITFATDFCGTCPHTQKKKNYRLNVVLKKQSFVDGGKNKIIFGWASRIWEDFLDRPFMQKTKKFRSFYILSRLGRSLKWNWLKQFSCRFASSLSKLRILERQIRGSQRNCFFCCWLGIVSSFFCGWSVSLFIFFCHVKNNSGCIVASQLHENKSNNETNFVWVKN